MQPHSGPPIQQALELSYVIVLGCYWCSLDANFDASISSSCGSSSVSPSSEGDAVVIINALTTANGDQTSYGNIIEDICALASSFQLVEFHHVPGACNLVANALAKKASTVTNLQVWLEDSPPDIISLVLRDAFVVKDVH